MQNVLDLYGALCSHPRLVTPDLVMVLHLAWPHDRMRLWGNGTLRPPCQVENGAVLGLSVSANPYTGRTPAAIWHGKWFASQKGRDMANPQMHATVTLMEPRTASCGCWFALFWHKGGGGGGG